MIHVQGQARANWRRHADFTALMEWRANPAHRPFNPFLATPNTGSAPAQPSLFPQRLRPAMALPFISPQGSNHMDLEPHMAPGDLGKADGNHNPGPNRNDFKLKVRCYLYKNIGHILCQEIALPEAKPSPLPTLFSELQIPSSLLSWTVPPEEVEEKGGEVPHFFLMNSSSDLFCGSNMIEVYVSLL